LVVIALTFSLGLADGLDHPFPSHVGNTLFGRLGFRTIIIGMLLWSTVGALPVLLVLAVC
jgi:hypothetical protein